MVQSGVESGKQAVIAELFRENSARRSHYKPIALVKRLNVASYLTEFRNTFIWIHANIKCEKMAMTRSGLETQVLLLEASKVGPENFA